MKKYHVAGDAFCERLASFQRPLYLLAHHDDELQCAGVLQRLGPRTQVVWMTNSDGLYTESKLTPPEYGELRKAEGLKSVGTLGIPASNTRCLDFSEVEIYRRMAWLYSGEKTMAELKPWFQEMRDAVRKAVFDLKPDMVFTQAWQGGQPEHDLVHFFTVLAVRDFMRETGAKVELYQMPAYEYTILISMRFHPMYKGPRLRIRLTPAELQKKLEMTQAYPSQVRLFEDFRKVFKVIGWFGLLIGGPRTAEDFMSVEEFGPVPDGIDYAAKPHAFEYFTYMFDDFEGTKVTFLKSIRPIVQAFLGA